MLVSFAVTAIGSPSATRSNDAVSVTEMNFSGDSPISRQLALSAATALATAARPGRSPGSILCLRASLINLRTAGPVPGLARPASSAFRPTS